MKTIKDPENKKIKEETVSVLVSRKAHPTNKYKTLIIKLFDINNPHKTTIFPKKIYEFTNIEKARIRRLNVSYYLEGNDIVINDLEEIYIIKEESKITLKGYQYELEKRKTPKHL